MAKLQFVPFQSTIEPGFWHWLSTYKLEHLKLSEEPVELRGSFHFDVADAPPRLRLDHCQHPDDHVGRYGRVEVKGVLRLFNTIESFRKYLPAYPDASALEDLRSEMQEWLTAGVSRGPVAFTLFVFADIKRHKFSFQFHFPALGLPASAFALLDVVSLMEAGIGDELDVLLSSRTEPIGPAECVAVKDGKLTVVPLSEGAVDSFDGYFLVPDPSNTERTPAWNLRSFLSALAFALHGKSKVVRIICLRGMVGETSANSYALRVQINGDPSSTLSETKLYGWEKGGVRTVDLGAQMDPVLLADSLSALNLKLMRWQMAPNLDLERIAGVRCLLLGAGTLGTYVSRGLLAWGVRHVTFVDSGVVAYSNPVRQSLFEFADCRDGGKPKATAAADALLRILPTVRAEGVVMTVPMPGHGVGGDVDAVRKDVARLEELFDAHDVVFLLLDSREARWLPTVLGKTKDKIVLNAALGFDSYLAMRHGRGPNLGCYFCTNVSAPGDSSVDRTLDQQCTVTRPGVAVIASGLVVELMAGVLAHPDGADAPAAAEDPCALGVDDDAGGRESALGSVPHTIRGFLRSFHQMTPVTPAFSQCVACSDHVVNAYKERGAELVLEVLDRPAKLEEITGLDRLQADCDPSDVWAFSDEESTGSCSGAGGDVGDADGAAP